MKKIIALLLLLGATVCLFGCGDEAPDGYMSVSLDSDPFILYVPKSWNDNSASGVASAHVSSETGALISARAAEGGTMSLAEYAALVWEEYGASFASFEPTGAPEETTLGAAAALRFGFTARVRGTLTRVQTYIGQYGSYFVTLTYSAPESLFERYLPGFEGAVENFVYRTPTVSDKVPKQVGNMLLCSSDQFEFQFYVPLSWLVDVGSEIPTATLSEGGKTVASVSLNSMLTSADVTDGASYFEAFRKDFTEGTLENVVSGDGKLGSYDAFDVTFDATVKGTTYTCRQVILSTKSMLYIFTYAAEKADFGVHLADAEAMLDAFEFSK